MSKALIDSETGYSQVKQMALMLRVAAKNSICTFKLTK